MLEGMKAEIDRLEADQRAKNPADSAGFVYALRASSFVTNPQSIAQSKQLLERLDEIKVGSAKNLNLRLNSYRTGRAHDSDIEVLYKLRTDNYTAVEKCVKAWLEDTRMRKYREVYKVDLALVKKLMHGCDELGRMKILYASRRPKRAPLDGGGGNTDNYFFVFHPAL